MSEETSKVEANRGQFKKGKVKTGGRVAGTPNKRTQDLTDKIEKDYPGYDPVLSMVAISQDPNTPLEMKITCHKEVAKYVHPQRKAVEIANEVELPPIKIEGIKI